MTHKTYFPRRKKRRRKLKQRKQTSDKSNYSYNLCGKNKEVLSDKCRMGKMTMMTNRQRT